MFVGDFQHLVVASYPVVLIMPTEFGTQDAVLLAHGFVQVIFTPVPYPAEKTAQPFSLGLSLDGPSATARLGPVVGESQKRKVPRPFASLPIRSAELHHPAFLRMDAQSIPLESLRQDLINSLRVALHAESHYEIIRIPHQKTVPSHPRSDLPLEPFVQHQVQTH